MQEYLYSAVYFSSLRHHALLYFRYVFGFFSRIFERQADLHIFQVGLDPANLIESL